MDSACDLKVGLAWGLDVEDKGKGRIRNDFEIFKLGIFGNNDAIC